jgi:peptide-methionine (S)-S-oxide reductase
VNAPATPAVETATLGGGCFWCTEAVFDRLEGVLSVESGYSGGAKENPTYREVCSGDTGHAEVVQVRFDPSRLSYEDVLEVFFATHDPTTKDRQGNDAGTQYRSVVFAHDERQARVARAAIERLGRESAFDAPIVTEVVPFERFWKAEDSHQDFFAENPAQPYCRAVVAPKVAKFERRFAERLRNEGARRGPEAETRAPKRSGD